MNLQCPVPAQEKEVITLGHGSGGRLTHQLINDVFLKEFSNSILDKMDDQAVVNSESKQIAMTTDSYVVNPIFFPGGDIGKLAICGTINDLAVGGAIPKYISVAFIIEEGFLLDDLKRIVKSMAQACQEAGVKIITGDTKVVERGKGDQIYINTTGIGFFEKPYDLDIKNINPGDHILVSGGLGEHGMTIMTKRESIELDSNLESDCADLSGLIKLMLQKCPQIKFMRDLTRGGLASSVVEVSKMSNLNIRLFENKIPISPQVQSCCEVLGLDPLHVANEGKIMAIVPSKDSDKLLEIMHSHPLGKRASIVGEILSASEGVVTMKVAGGGERIIMMLAGEQLPRIC